VNTVPAEPSPVAQAEIVPAAGHHWTRSRWLVLILLVFGLHLALLVVFGSRKQTTPRVATRATSLVLVDHSSEWLALNDPTLFALPHPEDFSSAIWPAITNLDQSSYHWTEDLRWLSLPTNELGTVFDRFMQTNRFAGFRLDLQPPVRFSAPVVPIAPVFAAASTLQIDGGSAGRQLLNPITLPSWPYPDLIAPSKVQVLVDAAGRVVSAVLLPPENPEETATHYDLADQSALTLARSARFKPSSQPDLVRMIFHWRTVPPLATNTLILP
jgi:hypothetical protein